MGHVLTMAVALPHCVYLRALAIAAAFSIHRVSGGGIRPGEAYAALASEPAVQLRQSFNSNVLGIPEKQWLA